MSEPTQNVCTCRGLHHVQEKCVFSFIRADLYPAFLTFRVLIKWVIHSKTQWISRNQPIVCISFRWKSNRHPIIYTSKDLKHVKNHPRLKWSTNKKELPTYINIIEDFGNFIHFFTHILKGCWRSWCYSANSDFGTHSSGVLSTYRWWGCWRQLTCGFCDLQPILQEPGHSFKLCEVRDLIFLWRNGRSDGEFSHQN